MNKFSFRQFIYVIRSFVHSIERAFVLRQRVALETVFIWVVRELFIAVYQANREWGRKPFVTSLIVVGAE